ncbi:GTP-binding protein [Aegicerativicinus sediminis]
MDISNEIALRPRFVMDLYAEPKAILNAFELAKTNQSDLIVTRLDDHVFIKFIRVKREMFTPQLQLELISQDEQPHQMHALMGPSPGLWTLFMFLHFVIAILFMTFGIWLYSNIRTHEPIAIPIFFMLLMVFLWFGLYFLGRFGRRSSSKESHALINFLENILKSHNIRYNIKQN